MKKELILLRHGKSDWDAETDDFHRPLKNRGKKGAKKIGLWLKKNSLIPDHVISSPAKRTKSTAEIACKIMGISIESIEWNKRIYLASENQIVKAIQSCPSEINRLMIVGHNPGLEQLVLLLAGKELAIPDDGKLLPTASLALFRVDGEWKNITTAGLALTDLVRAKNLDKKKDLTNN